MAKNRKKRGVPPPKDETKEQRFIRVCTLRVRKAVKMFGNIANCSGVAYAYTPAQVEAMFKVLQDALDSACGSFTAKVGESTEFDFKPPE